MMGHGYFKTELTKDQACKTGKNNSKGNGITVILFCWGILKLPTGYNNN